MKEHPPLIKNTYYGLRSVYATPHTCGMCSEHIASNWNFCPECGTPTGLTDADKQSECNLTEATKKEYITRYAPGDTVFDEIGRPWKVRVAELREIRDGLHWLYRCGHDGTEDYCALYDWEVVSEQDAPLAREREKERLAKLFRTAQSVTDSGVEGDMK